MFKYLNIHLINKKTPLIYSLSNFFFLKDEIELQ